MTQSYIILYNPIYDYPLDVPLPPWYADQPNASQLINDWYTLSVEEQLAIWHAEGEIWSNNCTASSGERIRENCTLLVFVVFYDLFHRIYPERDLMLSDILAVTYILELGPVLNFSRADAAKQALGANYFGIIEQYCINMEISECDTTAISIEHLVHRYTYINQFNSSITTSGYLATLQAWYDDAISIANWYFGTSDDQLDLILTVSNILNTPNRFGASRLRLLLTPPADEINLLVAKLQLSEGRTPYPYVVWGNHAYANSANSNAPYNQVINLWMGQGANPNASPIVPGDIVIKFCKLNLYQQDYFEFPTGDSDFPYGGEDAFVIHTTGELRLNFGTTSTYSDDIRTGNIPGWFNTDYTFTRYRQCSCLDTGNVRYPDTRRCQG